jgi:hypothetical protein
MKRFILPLMLAGGVAAQAGVIRLVTPPVVQKIGKAVGHAVKKPAKAVGKGVGKVVW